MKWLHDITAKTGIVTGFLLIVFFLFVKYLRISYVLNLHYLNEVFIFFGIWYAIRQRSRTENFKYLKGFFTGIKASAIASLIFNFFLLIYLSFIDPYFMQYIIKEGPLGEYMSPIIIALVLFTEQISAGLIFTLILMQLYRTKG
jgi:hypothetical protein